MASCQTIKIPARIKVCAGALRFNITLFKRELNAPTDVDVSIEFLEQVQTRAAIVITRGSLNVNNTNIEDVATHLFYIRHIADINSSWIIQHDNEFFRILHDGLNALDNRKFYLQLKCTRRGTTAQEVNFV